MNGDRERHGSDPGGLTQRQAAEKIGKSVGWINRLVKEGRVPLLDNGKIDPEGLATVVITPVSTGPVRANGGTLVEARTEREQYAAKDAALNYYTRIHALTPTAEVEAQNFEQARAFRDAMLGIPASVAPQLVGLTDQRVIEFRVRAAITKALGKLAAGTDDPDTPPGPAH